MARTLDFQSKNVGSIPSDPRLLFNYTKLKINNFPKKKIFFDFFFVSLFAPNFYKNFNFFNENCYLNMKKINIKQSYIVFSWFYYLTLISKKKNKKINFFVFPKNKYVQTHTRAPIAHKTWSKEQFLFNFYLIKISFKTKFENESPSSVSGGLFAIIISSQYFPIFETNVLFLKYFKFIVSLHDKKYFIY